MCAHSRAAGGTSVIDPGDVLEGTHELAEHGLRVLAMAVGWGEEAAAGVRRESPQGLEFIGLSGRIPAAYIGAMYFEPTHRMIRLQPLEFETWLRIVLVALSIVLAIELHKRLRQLPGGEASPPVEAS
jgi:hypothetical protein